VADFVFKNLSVKLMPDDSVEDSTIPPFEHDCHPCTNDCTGCTAFNTCCGDCTNCSEVTCQLCTCGTGTDILIVSEPEFDEKQARDVRSELAAHHTHLRLALAQVELAQRQPQSIGEIDELKSRMQEAMAELDERRATLETDEGP
jgi:hypothetical protein